MGLAIGGDVALNDVLEGLVCYAAYAHSPI